MPSRALFLESAPWPRPRPRRGAGGGDGTLNASIQVLVESGLPLRIIPLGTANNLARTLGIPFDPEGACALIAAGHRRRIDLGWVNDRYFCTTASVGLSVQKREEVESLRARAFEIRTRRPMPIDLDGEIGAETPARLKVVPRALEVFVPAPAAP